MGRWRIPIGVVVVVAVSALLGSAGPARGLVLHPDGETPPASHPDDAAIGRWSTNASCVAVGPNTVVTTCHQGGGVGTNVYFPDADGDGLMDHYTVAEIFQHNKADIRVARLLPVGDDPDLTYYIAPYTGTPSETTYASAVVGGYGKGRGADLVNGADITYGYEWGGADNLTLRWGQNKFEGTGQGNGTFTSAVLTADFDGVGGVGGRLAAEAAIAEFDSGGGWFLDVQSGPDVSWRLAGLSRGAEHAVDAESLFLNPETGTPDPDGLDAVRVGSYAGWITGVLEPHRWTGDTGGAWSSATNWSTTVPNAAERWAVFTDDAPGRTVVLGAPATVGVLRFDAAGGYTLTGTSTLTLRSDDNVAGIEINRLNGTVWYGAHRIETPVYLASPLVVMQRSTGTFTMAGAVSGPGSVRKVGWGTMALTSANTFLGDVIVAEGTLRAEDPGALGAGDARLEGGRLTLAWDADALFPSDVTVNASSEIRVEPLAAGTGRTLSLATLTTQGIPTLTVTGTAGYGLAVQGLTKFSAVVGTVTLATSADLALLGGTQLVVGTVTKTGGGTLTVDGAQAYGTDTRMNVDGGTLRLESDAGPTEAVLAVHVRAASASAEFASTQHLAELHLAAGSAACDAGGAGTFVTGALAIDAGAGGAPNAVFDLAESALVIDYAPGAGPYDQVAAWIRSGFADGPTGFWDGPGITSTAAAACADRSTALGVLDNADPVGGGRTTFAGEAVDADSVLVAYTWAGDLNLDGVVDFNDYNIIDNTFLAGAPPAGGYRWNVGDVNYDGTVDFNDYNVMDNVFLAHGGETLASSAGPEAADAAPTNEILAAPGTVLDDPSMSVGTGVVPEPATVLLVAAGAAGAWASRRRSGRRAPRG